MKRILVVDDEPTILAAVATRLRAEAFSVETAVDGPSAVAKAAATDPDLVVLDVMLPGFDGLEVCRRIQAARSDARADADRPQRRDGHVDRPRRRRRRLPDQAVQHARARRPGPGAAAPRGTVPADAQPLAVGDYRIDLQARRVHRGDEEIHLTRTEFDLLVFLAGRPRAAVPRETLLEQVWGWASGVESRTVDSHVKALRRKLGAELIRTVHGVGYALEMPR